MSAKETKAKAYPGNGRIGEVVHYLYYDDQTGAIVRIDTGKIIEVGVPNDNGHPLNIRVLYDEDKREQVHQPWETHYGRRILFILPNRVPLGVAKFAAANNLRVIRWCRNSRNPAYEFVDNETYEQLYLADRSVEMAELRYDGCWCNGRFSVEETNCGAEVGNRKIELPEGFEPNYD